MVEYALVTALQAIKTTALGVRDIADGLNWTLVGVIAAGLLFVRMMLSRRSPGT